MLAGSLWPVGFPRPALRSFGGHRPLLADRAECVVWVVIAVALQAYKLEPFQRLSASLLSAVHQMVNVLALALPAPLAHPASTGYDL